MDRVMFFIDGFNVYHSLNIFSLQKKGSIKYKHFEFRKYLWLDLRSLAERFTRKQDTISGVFYFSAYATWKPYSMKRHKRFVGALESRGVNVVMGRFKEKDRYCKICGASYKGREEKQTDVNIAIYLFKEAVADNYDTAILITSDTDLVPAIKEVRSLFPQKKIGVVFPFKRWAFELRNACHFYRIIEKKHLSKNQLPDQVPLPNGITLNRPRRWRNGHPTHWIRV
jgi:uncharacterized LabA/DUF88 family protein